MQLPASSPSHIEFICNVCGTPNRLPAASFHRELAPCSKCGANPRFRGILRALALGLGLDPRLPLPEWPRMKRLRGLGMSDWDGYARLLRDKFDYVNTFFDRAPQLDIQEPASDQLACYDFVISTDVFEHILPPLQKGFDNLYQLLKPGGCLIFSVPYTREPATLEHFSDLHQFAFLDFQGTRILVNRAPDGRLAAYDNLVFHGGEGATLEMRLFCEADVLARLARAGFADITVHDRPDLASGYYWPSLPQADPAAPHLHAYIIGARRP